MACIPARGRESGGIRGAHSTEPALALGYRGGYFDARAFGLGRALLGELDGGERGLYGPRFDDGCALPWGNEGIRVRGEQL